MRVQNEIERPDSIALEDLKYVTVYLPYDVDKNAKVKVPRFLVNAFIFLHDKKYLETEGIYRKQGNSSKITGVQNCFLSGEISQDLSIIDVCVLVKRFVKSIKGGLFGQKEEQIVSAAFDRHGSETPRTLCHFCHTLPSCNYGILCYIIFQLSRVVRHSKNNKMDAENLAIIFVPVMFQSFERNLGSIAQNIEGIRSNQLALKRTILMLLKHVRELIEPPPTYLIRNTSLNRAQLAHTSNVAIAPKTPSSPSVSNSLPKRSSSMPISNKPAVVIPRYTHAAAPNVVRTRGSSNVTVEKKNSVLRSARRRSKSVLRNVINFVSGGSEQHYSVSEDAGNYQ